MLAFDFRLICNPTWLCLRVYLESRQQRLGKAVERAPCVVGRPPPCSGAPCVWGTRAVECLVLWGACALQCLVCGEPVLWSALCVGSPCCGAPCVWGAHASQAGEVSLPSSHPQGVQHPGYAHKVPALLEADEQHHCIGHSMCPERSDWGRGDWGWGWGQEREVGTQGAFTEPWRYCNISIQAVQEFCEKLTGLHHIYHLSDHVFTHPSLAISPAASLSSQPYLCHICSPNPSTYPSTHHLPIHPPSAHHLPIIRPSSTHLAIDPFSHPPPALPLAHPPIHLPTQFPSNYPSAQLSVPPSNYLIINSPTHSFNWDLEMTTPTSHSGSTRLI